LITTTKTRDELFLDKIWVDPFSGCWIWTAHITDFGYGQFWDGERLVGAHVYSYRRAKGPVPEGKDLDHLCRVRKCVCPDHLEPVTRQVNLLRGDTIPAKNAAKTHCDSGHEFTEENIYLAKNGSRCCKECRAANNLRWANENRERRRELDRECYRRRIAKGG
jgi:HNH endonuclease